MEEVDLVVVAVLEPVVGLVVEQVEALAVVQVLVEEVDLVVEAVLVAVLEED